MAIDWGVIAQIVAVLGGFSAFLLWLVRMVIKQMLADFRDSVIGVVELGIKNWARGEFVAKLDFAQHAERNVANQGELTRVINELVRDQNADHVRVRDLEKSVDKIKFAIEAQE